MSSKRANALQNQLILFVQKGGEGAHADEQVLATYLTGALAPE